MEFRRIRFEPEWMPPGLQVGRHRHFEAYATVVLDGCFEQAGYSGRWRVEAGDVLIQPTLDAHADRMLSRGLWLQRLPWHWEEGLGGVFRPAALDGVILAAREDPRAAAVLLAAALRPVPRLRPLAERAGDLLAAAIGGDCTRRIGELSEELGLVRETASRCFGRSFGVAPARFAAELRARSAWLRILGSRESLGGIAADAGFADQAHMSRTIRALTGQPPGRLRQAAAGQILGANAG